MASERWGSNKVLDITGGEEKNRFPFRRRIIFESEGRSYLCANYLWASGDFDACRNWHDCGGFVYIG